MIIAFFIQLHIVNIRDDKNVIKITNSKKNICSTKNCSYHLNKIWFIVPVNLASKVSKRNMNKSIVKRFMKMLKILFLKLLTDREKSI